MDIAYRFVNYGEDLSPQPDAIILDVGMKTVPGVIDHHHPQAEPECTASLLVKYPRLVLDHLKGGRIGEGQDGLRHLTLITHRLPDFDAVASVFLTLKIVETDDVDASMKELARYARMVDSASLPPDIELTITPYSILRALFAGARKEESEINNDRMSEGLRFMRFLHSKAEEGYDILENRLLFSGIDRYAQARRKAEEDYFQYLQDLGRAKKIMIRLPLASGEGRKTVDGLVVRNPRSFLLKEWARRDNIHAPLKEGFSLILTNFGNERFIIGVDPQKGVNLRGLADILNRKELDKRKAKGLPPATAWYAGNCPLFGFRIIDSPTSGTILKHEDVENCLLSFGKMTD